MSIALQYQPAAYTLTNAEQTVAIPWRFLENDTIKITNLTTDTVLVIGTHYTLTGRNETNGGTATFTGVAVSVDDDVKIERFTGLTQTAIYEFNGRFPSSVQEYALDKLTLIGQELAWRISVNEGDIETLQEEYALIEETVDAAVAAAQAARVAAVAAKDAAETAQGASETAAAASQGFRDEAEGFRDEAEGFRDDAEDSATAAAGSATQAANTIAVTFKGGVAGNAVPNTLPLAGDYYRVTSAGTSQSKTWAIGDYAVYNGTSGAWTQLTGLFLPVTEEVDTRLAALLEREGLRFDGTNPVLLSGVGYAFGTSDFALVAQLYVPSSAIGTRMGVFGRVDIVSPFAGSSIQADGTITYEDGLATRISTTCPVDRDFVLWIDRAGTTFRLYIDGVLAGTITGVSDMSSVARHMIGGVQTGAELPLKGRISRVSVWNMSLASDYASLINRGLVTLPEQRGGSMTALTAGSFVVGKRYRIVTVGTTSFTGIGASANTVGIEFTATGVGTGTGTAIPLGTLFELDSGQRSAGYMVRDTSGNGRHVEMPASGVEIIDPDSTGQITYTRTSDGYVIGDRVVIPTGYVIASVFATGDGTATLGESAGTPANVCASATLTSTPQSLPVLVATTSNQKLYIDLGTATTATFTINLRKL